MGTIALIGVGVFIGWALFRPKQDNRGVSQQRNPLPQEARKEVHTGTGASGTNAHTMPEHNANHTLRNVAGGMVAGAVLGHMLSGDHKSEAHESINNYNIYNECYDHEDMAGNELDSEFDYDDMNYDIDDDSYDYTEYDDDIYDSGSDWGSDDYGDSYDGGDW